MDEEKIEPTSAPEAIEQVKEVKKTPKAPSLVSALLIALAVIVVVSAGWFFRSNLKSVYDRVAGVKTTTSSSSSADATANWKMYESTATGLSLKYPTDWTAAAITNNTADSGLTSFSLMSPEQSSLRSSAAAKGSPSMGTPNYDLLVRQWDAISSMYSGLGGAKPTTLSGLATNNDFMIGAIPTTFLGETAYEGERQGEQGAYGIVLIKDSKVYEFISFESETKAGLSSDLNTILASIKYNATLGWQTYTNTTYGFSFKYPATWTTTDVMTGDSGTTNLLFSTALHDPTDAAEQKCFRYGHIALLV
jgi:hypothetical protein